MSAREGVILLAEDDPNDVLLIQRAFQRSLVANPLQVVRDGEEALAYLSGQGLFADRERPPTAIIDIKSLNWWAPARKVIDTWAKQFVAVANDPKGKVKNASTFELLVW